MSTTQRAGARHFNLTASHVAQAENVYRMEAIAASLIEQGCNAKTAIITEIYWLRCRNRPKRIDSISIQKPSNYLYQTVY
jgi:hypothetical protein